MRHGEALAGWVIGYGSGWPWLHVVFLVAVSDGAPD